MGELKVLPKRVNIDMLSLVRQQVTAIHRICLECCYGNLKVTTEIAQNLILKCDVCGCEYYKER